LDRNGRWEAAKALSQFPDARASPVLGDTRENQGFGVRWLAAQGLIEVGRAALIPLMERLIERLHSRWLQEDAHYMLHAFLTRDPC
jgi:HEAT repeat protein